MTEQEYKSDRAALLAELDALTADLLAMSRRLGRPGLSPTQAERDAILARKEAVILRIQALDRQRHQSRES